MSAKWPDLVKANIVNGVKTASSALCISKIIIHGNPAETRALKDNHYGFQKMGACYENSNLNDIINKSTLPNYSWSSYIWSLCEWRDDRLTLFLIRIKLDLFILLYFLSKYTFKNKIK